MSFVRPDGEPMRPFSSVEEMDEALVENWNQTVAKVDTVYHLGDVVFPRKSLETLGRLNGRKILIGGNHDRYSLKDYAKYFEDIRGAFFYQPGSDFLGGLIMTHIPVHPGGLVGHYRGNIHGHLHCHLVMDGEVSDPRYFNACLERNDYRPVHMAAIKKHFAPLRHAPSPAS